MYKSDKIIKNNIAAIQIEEFFSLLKCFINNI